MRRLIRLNPAPLSGKMARRRPAPTMLFPRAPQLRRCPQAPCLQRAFVNLKSSARWKPNRFCQLSMRQRRWLIQPTPLPSSQTAYPAIERPELDMHCYRRPPATGVFTSDADLFEHPEMLVDAIAETARVDAERLAYVDKSEGAVVVFGVDPIRGLEEFEPLWRIPLGIAIT